MSQYRITVNGMPHTVVADGDTPLSAVLRDELRLNGAGSACGIGQCGACTVLLDRDTALSCQVPMAAVGSREVRTAEGLANRVLRPAFVDERAAQCGYCIVGVMLRAQAAIERGGAPTAAEIGQHMAVNQCRCGTHARIVHALDRALARRPRR